MKKILKIFLYPFFWIVDLKKRLDEIIKFQDYFLMLLVDSDIKIFSKDQEIDLIEKHLEIYKNIISQYEYEKLYQKYVLDRDNSGF